MLGLSHALNIAFFTALAESGEAAPRLAQLSSTTYDAQVDVATRVAGENPEMYFEIQNLNDYGRESLLALRGAVERSGMRSSPATDRSLSAMMQRGREYLAGRSREPLMACAGSRKRDPRTARLASPRSSTRRRRMSVCSSAARNANSNCSRRRTLAQLFEAICQGLKTSYGLESVTLLLWDPQHEIRHLLIADHMTAEDFPQVIFADSVVGLAPQFVSFHKPWLGPYMGCDHQLLFPGCDQR